MKRIALIALFASVAMLLQSAAFAIGAAYSGSWYNPEQSGHGFSLEYSVLNDGTPVVVVYWYVYDTEGNPIFLIGVGEPEEDNTVTLVFEAPYGMKFGGFDPQQTVREDGGVGVFAFESSESGTFEYQPSEWIANAYGVSAITTPVVKLIGVAHPNPVVVEILIPGRITTTEREGEFPVCFNGDGELLPCADGAEPPTDEPVNPVGTWSGRMVYDRRSAAGNACYDADAAVGVSSTSSGILTLNSISVRPDTGGLYITSGLSKLMQAGIVSGRLTLGDQWADYTIEFFNDGHAVGQWTYYSNSECYGDWTFTKD